MSFRASLRRAWPVLLAYGVFSVWGVGCFVASLSLTSGGFGISPGAVGAVIGLIVATAVGQVAGNLLGLARLRLVVVGAAFTLAFLLSALSGVALGPFAVFLVVGVIAALGGYLGIASRLDVVAAWFPLTFAVGGAIVWMNHHGAVATFKGGAKHALWDPFALICLSGAVFLMLVFLAARQSLGLTVWQEVGRPATATTAPEDAVAVAKPGRGSLLVLFVFSIVVLGATALISPYLFRTAPAKNGDGTGQKGDPKGKGKEQPGQGKGGEKGKDGDGRGQGSSGDGQGKGGAKGKDGQGDGQGRSPSGGSGQDGSGKGGGAKGGQGDGRSPSGGSGQDGSGKGGGAKGKDGQGDGQGRSPSGGSGQDGSGKGGGAKGKDGQGDGQGRSPSGGSGQDGSGKGGGAKGKDGQGDGKPGPKDDPGQQNPEDPLGQPDPERASQASGEALAMGLQVMGYLLAFAVALLVLVLLVGPPIRRAFLLRHLERPLWPVSPTARVMNLWRRALAALSVVDISPMAGEAPRDFARRARAEINGSLACDAPGLEEAAAVVERLDYEGRGLGAGDEQVMRDAVTTLVKALGPHIGVGKKLASGWGAAPDVEP
jgi:hypothetical protein